MSEKKQQLKEGKRKKIREIEVTPEVEENKKRQKTIIRKIKEDKEEILKNRSSQVNLPSRCSNLDEPFIPTINAEDDFLVTTVKKILIKQKLPLRAHLPKVPSMMTLTNYKRALLLNNTMTLDKFSKWLKLLGYEYEIIVRKKENNDEEE